MWVFFALLPALVVLSIIVGGTVLLVRRGSDGWNIQFPGVLLGYAAVAMLVGVFLSAAGASLLLKAGLAQISERNFSYNDTSYTQYAPSSAPGTRTTTPQQSVTVDPSDAAIRDDVATGISLAFGGAVVLAVHALGATVLRRRHAPGASLVAWAYNLIGLAISTLGFIGTGVEALNDVMRRYVVGGDTVQSFAIRHPGEPLSVAIVLFPLMLWSGWRVWQELGSPSPDNNNQPRSVAPATAAGSTI